MIYRKLLKKNDFVSCKYKKYRMELSVQADSAKDITAV
jgi:hypothetical protein